jgi:TPR repeat protein
MKKYFSILLIFFCTLAYSQDLLTRYQDALNNGDFKLIEKLEKEALNLNDPNVLVAIANTYAINQPKRSGDYEQVFKFSLKALEIEPSIFGGGVANFTSALAISSEMQKEVLKKLNQSSNTSLRNAKVFLLSSSGSIDNISDIIKPRMYFGVGFDPSLMKVMWADNDSRLSFLQKNDQVLSLNSKEVNNFNEFQQVQSTLTAGQKSSINFIRNGATISREFIVPELSLSIYDEITLLSSYSYQGLTEDAIYHAEKAELKIINSSMDNSNLQFQSAMIDFAYCNAYAHKSNEDLDKLAFNKCLSTVEKIDANFDALTASNPSFTEGDKQRQLIIFNPFLQLSYRTAVSILSEYYLGDLRWTKDTKFVVKEPDVDQAMLYAKRSSAFFKRTDREAVSFAIAKIHFKEFDESLIEALEIARISNSKYYSIDGLMRLIRLYEPNGPLEDIEKEITYLKDIVKISDDPYYQFRLGSIYELGIGTKQSYQKAFALLEKAAEADHIRALNKIGSAYLNGTYYQQDVNKALEFFKKSKALGSEYGSKLLLATLMDYEIYGQDNLFRELYAEQRGELIAKLPDYLVLGFNSGFNSFPKDFDESCRLAKLSYQEKSNFISKYINGYCELSDDNLNISNSGLRELIAVSNNGSSKASTALGYFYYEQDNIKKADEFAKKAQKQLRRKDSSKIYKSYSWLNSSSKYFDTQKSDIDKLISNIKQSQREEKAYLAKLNAAKKEEQKKIIAQQKAIERRRRNESLSNAASGFFNFLGDVLIVAVTVAATAAVIDEVADSNPEALKAYANSQRSYSYTSEQYDWDGFYDVYDNWTYRCRSISTGRFADNYQCVDKYKDDDRWPSNY